MTYKIFIFCLDHGSINFYPGGVNPEDDNPDGYIKEHL